MTELPSGTVTFLFTDIEGSTQLERQLRERYGDVLREHQAIVRAAFAAHGGHEIDTQGDSFFYVFPRAKAAVDAAVDAQKALAGHTWPEDGEVRVRIGISTGEASLEGGRYVGFAVHRAARISAAGHGGQILLSDDAVRAVEASAPANFTFRALGDHRLRGLPEPVTLFQLEAPGLPARFSAPRATNRSFADRLARDEPREKQPTVAERSRRRRTLPQFTPKTESRL
jgi:class 3 adenylate cyclase